VYYFESILTQQEDQLAVAQGQIALDLIAVYRALGGGWEMRLTRDSEAIVDNAIRTEPGMRMNERPRAPGGTPDAGPFKVQGTPQANDAPTISPVKTSPQEGGQLPASVGRAAPHKQLSEHVWE
jgi:hypothetical protein